MTKCKEKCNVNRDEVEKFELTDDILNLPNSYELKCYFLCGFVECGMMNFDSYKFDPSVFIDLVPKLTDKDHANYIKLSRGCLNRIRKIKDPIEVAYEMNVCMKQNAPEVRVFYLFV